MVAALVAVTIMACDSDDKKQDYNPLIDDPQPEQPTTPPEQPTQSSYNELYRPQIHYTPKLLAKLDGINIENAKKSIQRYNELAHAGKDVDFGKPASRMFPIEHGPFYAFMGGMNFNLCTICGLICDTDCHVLDADANVIPGLYVAGNAQGGRFAVNYIPTMSGMSHSIAMYYGYVAGKNIAAGN